MRRSSDPAKRIPKSLGTESQIIGRYSLADLAVAGLPGVAVILLTQMVFPSDMTVRGIQVSALTIPIAAVAFGAGGLFVYLTPRYTNSFDWLGLFAGFHRSETQLDHEEAKEYTKIERVYPRHDAIERTDRALVGAVQVSPPTMALATDEEWNEKAEAFQDFVNTTVEFPIQIYSTTQSFPADEYVGRYQERLDDPDVEANDQLAALIRNYVDWYERELAQRQMTIRDHYILIPVRPREVRYEQEGLLAKVTDIPLVGTFVAMCTAPPPEEERAAMIDELADRRRRIERGLRSIDGCQSHPVEATDLTRLVAEYWTGTEIEYGSLDQALRTTEVVSNS